MSRKSVPGRISHQVLTSPAAGFVGQIPGAIVEGFLSYHSPRLVWFHLVRMYQIVDLISFTALVAIPTAFIAGRVADSLSGGKTECSIGAAMLAGTVTVVLLCRYAIWATADV